MVEAVIGLEVHVELKTRSKLFCSCSTKFGSEANSQVCPVCLGLPGTVPALNKQAVEHAVLACLSLQCEITEQGGFDRKNYYYPDMPKSYQISQVFSPIGKEGELTIDTAHGEKMIRIRQIHLEEDAGKLVHEGDNIASAPDSLVDLNRSGAPLIEIVSYPDIRNSDEAVAYLENLRSILRYVNVSDCRMEEGSFRCDGNISVREEGSSTYNPKVEIKNMNSLKALQKALDYEIDRQTDLLNNNERVMQETRTWDDQKEMTVHMRSKEAPDYRVFPDPELGLLKVDESWKSRISKRIPELPAEKKRRYKEQWSLSDYDAYILSRDKNLAAFYEQAVEHYHQPKKISNWIQAELLRLLNAERKEADDSPVLPEQLANLVALIDQGEISGKMGKEVIEIMYEERKDPRKVIEERGLSQISDDSALEEIAEQIVEQNPKPVQDYRDGKKKAMGFLVGQMMKATKGQANPKKANEILREVLEE